MPILNQEAQEAIRSYFGKKFGTLKDKTAKAIIDSINNSTTNIEHLLLEIAEAKTPRGIAYFNFLSQCENAEGELGKFAKRLLSIANLLKMIAKYGKLVDAPVALFAEGTVEETFKSKLDEKNQTITFTGGSIDTRIGMINELINNVDETEEELLSTENLFASEQENAKKTTSKLLNQLKEGGSFAQQIQTFKVEAAKWGKSGIRQTSPFAKFVIPSIEDTATRLATVAQEKFDGLDKNHDRKMKNLLKQEATKSKREYNNRIEHLELLRLNTQNTTNRLDRTIETANQTISNMKGVGGKNDCDTVEGKTILDTISARKTHIKNSYDTQIAEMKQLMDDISAAYNDISNDISNESDKRYMINFLKHKETQLTSLAIEMEKEGNTALKALNTKENTILTIDRYTVNATTYNGNIKVLNAMLEELSEIYNQHRNEKDVQRHCKKAMEQIKTKIAESSQVIVGSYRKQFSDYKESLRESPSFRALSKKLGELRDEQNNGNPGKRLAAKITALETVFCRIDTAESHKELNQFMQDMISKKGDIRGPLFAFRKPAANGFDSTFRGLSSVIYTLFHHGNSSETEALVKAAVKFFKSSFHSTFKADNAQLLDTIEKNDIALPKNSVVDDHNTSSFSFN